MSGFPAGAVTLVGNWNGQRLIKDLHDAGVSLSSDDVAALQERLKLERTRRFGYDNLSDNVLPEVVHLADGAFAKRLSQQPLLWIAQHGLPLGDLEITLEKRKRGHSACFTGIDGLGLALVPGISL